MIRINDKLPRFKVTNELAMNDALKEASRDGLIRAKNIAPYQKGGLRANSFNNRVSNLHWQIIFDIEYAAYQEFGQRKNGSHRVRKYSTSGTGKRYLKTAGDEQLKKLPNIFKKHARMVKV